jgi:hypothetical protein
MGYFSAVAINASYIPNSAEKPLQQLGFLKVNKYSGGSAIYTGNCYLLGTKSAVNIEDTLTKIALAIGDYHKGLTVSFYWEDSYDRLTMFYKACRSDNWQEIVTEYNKEEDNHGYGF